MTASVPQWRSIDSAPKDGTFIDLWSPAHGRRIPDCKWSVRRKSWMLPGGVITIPDDGVSVTHWQPLPAPPVITTKDDDDIINQL